MFEACEFGASEVIRLRVPASTSNLGPGFDLLGLALSMFLDVRLSRAQHGREAEIVAFEGEARTWPRGRANLLLDAFERAARQWGLDPRGCELRALSAIPVSRGLGSSAAAIAAGLVLGAAIAPGKATREELLALACEIEGHPDNVSPALFGGCVLALPRPPRPPRLVRVALHPSLAFALAWPEAPLETSFARGLLPRQVPFADAVENPRRLALLLEGLRTGDPELLALGGEDRLHVPYRLPHIPGGAEALEAARAAGAQLATISGSGSALLAIAPRARAQAAAEAMAAVFRARGAGGTARLVEPVLEPPVPCAAPGG